eukprot:COSAG02_NODE_51913_length_311_cov_0.721698_1_plen_84_part_10
MPGYKRVPKPLGLPDLRAHASIERLDVAFDEMDDPRSPDDDYFAKVNERKPWVPLGPQMTFRRVSPAAAWVFPPKHHKHHHHDL